MTPAPIVAVTYGQPKIGKTLDALASFPTALVLHPRGTIRGCAPQLGFTPKSYTGCAEGGDEVVTLLDVLQKLNDIAAHANQLWNHHDTIVIDDFTTLAENQIVADTKTSGKNKYAKWESLKALTAEILTVARTYPFHTVINAHEIAPGNDVNEVYQRGGPSMPSAKSRNLLCGLPDMVLRATSDVLRKPWPLTYTCRPSPDWITADRNGVAVFETPSNLGELFRASGFAVRRREDWQESVVSTGAAALDKREPQAAVFASVAAACRTAGADDRTTYWLLRDVLARHELRAAATNPLSVFGLTPATAVPTQQSQKE